VAGNVSAAEEIMSYSMTIVTCSSTQGLDIDAANLLEEVYREAPAKSKADALAGPNELLQFLLDGPVWLGIAKGLMAAFGVAFAAKAGEAAWQALVDAVRSKPTSETVWAPEQLDRLLLIIERALESNTVTFGPKYRGISFAGRAPAIQVRSANPEALFEISAALALGADVLVEEMAKADRPLDYAMHDNDDRSPAIFIETDGSLSVTFLLTNKYSKLTEAYKITSGKLK
jgi:hypothetical protein